MKKIKRKKKNVWKKILGMIHLYSTIPVLLWKGFFFQGLGRFRFLDKSKRTTYTVWLYSVKHTDGLCNVQVHKYCNMHRKGSQWKWDEKEDPSGTCITGVYTDDNECWSILLPGVSATADIVSIVYKSCIRYDNASKLYNTITMEKETKIRKTIDFEN